ncbi:MAG TPA: PAS domain S-box protein [Candidatus Kapabacteria bacterium]|nr:PAS domain S-box protein [Candidatus Kapabacteria bacterium]
MPNTKSILSWAFEHSSDGMLVTDTGGTIIMVNNAFEKMFGYSPEETIGRRTNILRSRYSTPEFYQEMWRSLVANGEWKGEIINRTKSGIEKTCLLTITQIKTPEGEKIGYLGVEIDLTERKNLEEQIVQGEKLASIGESLATLIHEIRNPLNGIAMNAFMLERKNNSWDDEDRESLHLISTEVKRLEGMINTAMGYARRIELKSDRVIIHDFLKDIKALLMFDAGDLKVELIFETVSDTLSGYFDPNLIKQVMLNLAQNGIEAASHSQRSVVRVQAELQEHALWQSISASGKILLLTVENSGLPISEETGRNLFKPFFTTKTQGLGLGLATSAKIVRQHHGIIKHATIDEPPFTTRFTVAIPA